MLLQRLGAGLVAVTLFAVGALAQAPAPPSQQGSIGNPQAQDFYTISGRVFYGERMTIAPRILLGLSGPNGNTVAQTFSNEHGEFQFTGLLQNVYILHVNEEGYESVEERIDLNVFGSRQDIVVVLRRPHNPAEPAPAQPTVSVNTLKAPPEARKEFEKGEKELYDNNNAEKSVPHFRKAVEIYPEFDDAYAELSFAYLQLGRNDEAATVAARAVELNEQNARAHLLLSRAYLQLGKLDEAAAGFAKTLELDSNNWLAHLELAKLLFQQEKDDEALAHAQRARTLKPDVPSIYLLLYNLAVRAQDRQAALEALDEFLQRFPQHELAPKVREQRKLLTAAEASPQN